MRAHIGTYAPAIGRLEVPTGAEPFHDPLDEPPESDNPKHERSNAEHWCCLETPRRLLERIVALGPQILSSIEYHKISLSYCHRLTR